MPLGERFLFDLSFDEDDLALSEEEAKARGLEEEKAGFIDLEADIPSFTEEQVDEARKLGFEAGLQAGLEKATAENENSIQEVLKNISSLLETLLKNQAIDSTNTFNDAVKIALAITKKYFPHQNTKHGLNEIDFMVREVLKEIFDEPRVLIHINPKIKEFMTDQIKTITKEINFEGQVVLLEDKEIMLGDCKVDWSNGSAEREIESTMNKIDQIIENNLGNLYEALPGVSENEDNTADHMTLSEIVNPGGAASEGPTAETATNIVGSPLNETNSTTEDASSTADPSINDIDKAVHSPSDIAEANSRVERPVDDAMGSNTITQINRAENEEALGSSSKEKDAGIPDTTLSQEQSTADIQNNEVTMKTPTTDDEPHTSSNHDTTPTTEPIK